MRLRATRITAVAHAANRLLGGAPAWSPLSWFTSGEQGAWYDPSDLSSMFQDSAGTTPVTAVEQPVGRINDKSGRGNHASQATSTARPTLSARVNGFVSTNDLRVTPWSALNGLVSAFGASGEFKFVPNATTGIHGVSQSVTPLSHSVITIEAKAAELQILAFGEGAQTGNWCSFNLSTGVALFGANRIKAVALADGWWRLSTKIFDAVLVAAGNFGFRAMPNTATASDNPHIFNWAGDGVSGILLRNPQVTQSNLAAVSFGASSYVAETYQRVTTATDYDSDASKFPLYLAFDGSDDSMATSAIDFSATDKMTVVAGVTKLSDAAQAMLVELSSSSGANAGSFALRAPSDGLSDFSFASRGSATALQAVATGNASPIKRVVAGLSDISADLSILRINGVQAASSSADQGADNYGNYPLFIGSRNNASLRFNGRIHQLIIRGAASADIAQAEAFVAARTGVTL